MTNSEHRLGVSEANLVVRHLKLEQVDSAALKSALTEIDHIYGLDAISFDEQTRVLNLAYDASRLCLDGIETVLANHGVTVAHDWWTKFKEGYYRFVDENLADNAKHQPWSCHQLPPDTHKK